MNKQIPHFLSDTYEALGSSKLQWVLSMYIMFLFSLNSVSGATITVINATSCTAYDALTYHGAADVSFEVTCECTGGVNIGNIPPGGSATSAPYQSFNTFDFTVTEAIGTTVVRAYIGDGNLIFTIEPNVACSPAPPPDDASDGNSSPVGSPASDAGSPATPGSPPGPDWPLGEGSASSGDPGSGGANDSAPGGGSTSDTPCGMPRWTVSEPYISLWLHDVPFGYQPALGSRVSLKLAYKQREFSAGLAQNFFSVGRKWDFSWLSYVTRDSGGHNVLHFGGGQQRIFYGTNDYLTNTRLVGDTTNGFTVSYPDGSQSVYNFVATNGSGSFVLAFMTELWNAQGQKTRLVYSTYAPSDMPVIQLRYVIDGDGRTNTLYYTTGNSYGTNLISQVVDPFNRTNSFRYDNSGHLTNITDVAGLSTSFMYDPNDWVTNMTTPYGTNSFTITDSTGTVPNGRSVLVTEPDGGNELYLYQDSAPGVASSYTSPSSSPFANTFDNSDLNVRNTFHWGRRQYAALSTNAIASFTSGDYRKARMRHWLKSDATTVDGTLSLERDPSPDSAGSNEGQKTWYDYVGKTNTEYAGTQVLPLCVARVLPDSSTRFVRTERNSFGMVTRGVESYAGGTSYRTNVFTYAANGQDLLTLTNALGVQVSSNAYNGYHQVLTNFDALSERTVLTYNANQQPTSISRPSGLITTNLYLTSGAGSNFLDRTIDYSVGASTVYYGSNVFTWANDLVATRTGSRGLTTTNTWDNLQRLTSAADSRGTNSYVYANLDLVKTVDRMGYPTSFGYDSIRRLVASTNANGTVTRYGYCTCGALQAMTNAFGTTIQQVTTYSYDNQGNLTQTIGPDSYALDYNYNLLHQLTNVADSVSGVTNWFNNQGLFVASSNAFGQVSATTYDPLDRATNIVDANFVTIANTFDNLNRLLTRGYPDGGVESFAYTLNIAPPTTYTNQLGVNVVNYSYDPLNRKTNEIYVGLTTNSFGYSTANDLLSLKDGRGQITSWNYDQYGRTTNKVDATSTEILRFQYDFDDRLTNRWSKGKGNTVYAFDAAGNNTNVLYPVSPAISLQFDALNRLTNMVDAVGATHYGYTSASQLQSEDGPWVDDTVSYSYNNRLLTGLSLLAPNSSPWAQAYSYDGARRLSSLSSPAGTFGYVYDPARNLQTRSIGLPSGAIITNNYDNVARLLSTALKNSSGSTLNSHSYAYNAGSQRAWLTNTSGDYRNYTYDNIGQLKTAIATEPSGTPRSQEQLGYQYDSAGNLAWRTNNGLLQALTINNLNELSGFTNSGTLTVAGTTTSAATNVTVWGTSLASGAAAIYSSDSTWARTNVTLPNGSATYNASAQDNLGRTDTNTLSVNLPNGVGYQYDSNGNLTNDGLRSFVYDDENELISVVVTNGVGISSRSDFAYDGLQRRRVRTEMTWASGAWLTNQVVRYVYDRNLVIQERDANNIPTTSYTHGRDLSGTLQGSGGIGGLLARSDNGLMVAGQPSAHAYYHADANGNVTCLINTNQAIVALYLYDPSGNILSKRGALADANLYRFCSKEYHSPSGLVYSRYRFYDPGLQRWLNRDPIWEAGGLNLYLYAGNGMPNAVDPDGRLVGLTEAVVVIGVLGVAVVVWSYFHQASSAVDAVKSNSQTSLQQVNSRSLDLNNASLGDLGTLGQPLVFQDLQMVVPVAQSLSGLGTSASGGPLMPILSGEDAISSMGQQAITYDDTWDGIKTSVSYLWDLLGRQFGVPQGSQSNSGVQTYIGPNGEVYIGRNPPAGYHRVCP